MKSDVNFKDIYDLNEVKGKTVHDWLQQFADNDLTPVQFVQHWVFWIPKAFSPEQEFNFHEPIVNEEIFNTVLINTLEEFIFANDEGFQKLFSDVSKLKSVCGTIFKGGDPFYSCKDCGTDPTCVLCVPCFKMSEHKNHNYKIGTSGGGGSCDCGDVLSWKKNPHCEVHLQGLQNDSVSLRFPEALISRLELVITAVLHYCYDVLFLKSSSSSLPTILKIGASDVLGSEKDYYCVVLYNDERHTFDQVASALISALECTSADAFSLATYVHKEGRAILKCSSHSKCWQIKSLIDGFSSAHNSQPLKVEVHDWCLVVHQILSIKFLLWLENFTKQTQEFREVCTSIALKLNGRITNPSLIQGLKSSIVEGVLCNYTSVWKAARLSWKHLFLSVMLVDHNNKLAFGKMFTSNYKAIMNNFIKDDHDHAYSAASLSVQIFTVLPIAHYLIAYEDAISIMLNKFYLECIKLQNASGKLDFTNSLISPFGRSFCVLNDLRFILTSPPDEWTSDLRKGFLHGISGILEIFLLMEEMCGAKRQVGQHLEFEPEWKYGYKLQVNLAPVISQMLNWCSTDQIITLKAYKLVLKKLYDYYSPHFNKGLHLVTVLLEGHTMKCYDYNILTQPVSIHLPLCRFFSGLYLNVQKYGFHFNSPEFNALIKLTPLQIIEPVLRVQVMIAQAYAGLWKRNGHSLQNQINYYHSIRCRSEMQDKDIILLQIGASLIESNKYLLNLMYKFNLYMHWLNPEFESELSAMDDDTVKQASIIIEEFLLLLLVIIGERYHPGIGNVTPEECLQNEILHKLFIRPCLHSELYSLFPDNDCYKIRIEQVIDSVATFQKPNNSQKGVYVVKKELMNRYNPFFYHYSKEERSVSEDEQRKQQKILHGKEFCKPPILPKLNLHFQPIACLLHCDIMLLIMHTVLIRSQSPTSISVSYGQLQKVLFLIGFALESDECYCSAKFTTVANKWNIKGLLEQLAVSKPAKMHLDLINFLLKKYISYINDPEDSCRDNANKTEHSEDGGKQLTYSKLVAERKAAIMAKMSALQQNFMSTNANLFTELTGSSNDCTMNCEESGGSQVIASASDSFDKKLTCIICQEGQILSYEGSPMVCAAYIQKSTIIHENLKYWELLNFNIGTAVHVSTCGHLMHIKCWKDYIKITYSEESGRPFRMRQIAAFDTEKNEYLCPLCKCLSNTILPILPDFDVKLRHMLSEWLQNAETKYLNSSTPWQQESCGTCLSLTEINETVSTTQSSILNCPHHTITTETSDNICYGTKWGPNIPPNDMKYLSDEIISVIESFISSLSVMKEISPPVNENYFLLWHSCIYTIQSFENYHHFTGKSLFEGFGYRQEMCLRNLVNLSATFNILHRDKLNQYHQKILHTLLKTKESGWPDIFSLNCFELVFLLLMTSLSPKNLDSLQKILFDNNVIIIIIMLKFAQIISLGDINSAVLDDKDIISADTKCLAGITKQFKKCSGVNTIELWNLLKHHSLPFLRCCAILHYFLSGVEPTKSLKEFGGDSYENLMDYLGITNKCHELFESPNVRNIIAEWTLHPLIPLHISSFNTHPSKLIDLPHDYFDLINSASSFTCPNGHREDTRNLTMCLKCGELLCSDAYCCQKELNKVLVGSCTYHTHYCCAGNGIFLRLRECEVLLLSSDPSRGCLMPAPYFDEYGEADQGLLRGGPLYLCKSKYNDLQMLWLNHRIPEEISRSIEATYGFTSYQWHLL